MERWKMTKKIKLQTKIDGDAKRFIRRLQALAEREQTRGLSEGEAAEAQSQSVRSPVTER
jgi:hypothetical protein